MHNMIFLQFLYNIGLYSLVPVLSLIHISNTDFILGMYILKNMPNSESPSILDASIIDGGNAFALVLNIMINRGVASDGNINPSTVFNKPSLEYILNKEMCIRDRNTDEQKHATRRPG